MTAEESQKILKDLSELLNDPQVKESLGVPVGISFEVRLEGSSGAETRVKITAVGDGCSAGELYDAEVSTAMLLEAFEPGAVQSFDFDH